MMASFQKTTFKTGDIIITWYSTTNTLQTKGSGLPLCKQNWPVYSAKDELLTLQTSSDYMSSVDVNLMTAFLVPVVRRLISAYPGEKSESVFFCSNAFSLFLEHQKVDLLTITGRLSLLLKLSHLNSKFRQTLGYHKKALNNPAQLRQVLIGCHTTSKRTWSTLTWHRKMAMTDYGLSRPCDHSRKRPALVATTFGKPRLNCDLNFAIKSFR